MALDSYRPADRRRRRIALAAAVLPLCAGLLVVATPAPPAHAAACTSTVDCLSQMTLAEKAGQMTQVANTYVTNSQDIATYALGSVLSGGGGGPNGAGGTATQWADMVDGYQSHALSEPPRHPAAVRRRRRARPQQRPGRHPLPAPHRHGRDPRRGARPAGRGRHPAGGPRHRHPLDLQPVRVRPAGRPLGPHLRGVRRGSVGRLAAGARPPSGASRVPRSARPRSSPPPSTTWATAAPASAPATAATSSTRATPSSARPPCAPSTSRRTRAPSAPGWAR